LVQSNSRAAAEPSSLPEKRCRLFPAGLFNTAAMLSVFYALNHGKVMIVEPLVSSNPVMMIVLTAIFSRDVETLSRRVICGACWQWRGRFWL
jgi:uncharacterized membrane protein